MLGFLLSEGALTMGGMSAIFTNGLLNSLKTNIIDPAVEIIVPLDKLHDSDDPNNKNLKWKIFIKDLIIWIIILFLLYLLWKFVLVPLKPPPVVA
jgi:large-conductance mechanosensitive channel